MKTFTIPPPIKKFIDDQYDEIMYQVDLFELKKITEHFEWSELSDVHRSLFDKYNINEVTFNSVRTSILSSLEKQ